MKQSIMLYQSVAAGLKATAISKRINYPFKLTGMQIIFPIGSDSKLEVYPIVASDKTQPTTGVPPGTNILSTAGNVEKITGTAERLPMFFDIEFRDRGNYVKIYCVNGDGSYAHAVKAIFTIESIEKRGL